MEDLKLVTVKFTEENDEPKTLFDKKSEAPPDGYDSSGDRRALNDGIDMFDKEEDLISEIKLDLTEAERQFAEKSAIERDLSDISKLKSSAEIFGLTPRELEDEFIGYKIEKLFRCLDYFVPESLGELSLRERIYAIKRNGFGSITILPSAVSVAKKYIEDNEIAINTLLCYPYGEEHSRVKILSAKLASKTDTASISIPVNQNMLTPDRLRTTKKELVRMSKTVKGKELKIIVEPNLFSQSALVSLVKLCLDVHLSTICVKMNEGAIAGLKALKTLCGSRIKIEAMGEISLKLAASMLAIGVKKISASNVEELSAEIATKLKE